MSWVDVQADVLEAVETEETPAYIGDTLPVEVDENGGAHTIIPTDGPCFVIDWISASGQYTFGQASPTVADSVLLQVGAWAQSQAAAFDMAEAARAKLEPAHWEMTDVGRAIEDKYRGCLVTYRKLM